MIRELVQQNRSYRRFNENQRIDRAQLMKLVELARLSPSAANLQNLRYRLVYTREECDAIFPCLKWAAYLSNWDGPAPGERPSAYILIMAPENVTKFSHIDTGIAAQSMLLGAVSEGLGGCILASVDRSRIHSICNLPAAMDLVIVIALGKPAEKVVIEDLSKDDSIAYWRDDEGVHHVPKRLLKDLIL